MFKKSYVPLLVLTIITSSCFGMISSSSMKDISNRLKNLYDEVVKNMKDEKKLPDSEKGEFHSTLLNSLKNADQIGLFNIYYNMLTQDSNTFIDIKYGGFNVESIGLIASQQN